MSIATRLYLANTDALMAEGRLEALIPRLPPERQQRIARLRRREDQCLSAAAGLLLERALDDAGVPAGQRALRLGEQGKPYLAGREDVFFNLSHAGRIAVCLLSGHENGCDVETERHADLRVAERFFAPDEARLLRGAPEEVREELFFRLWTLKESFSKTLGAGLQVGFDRFVMRRQGSEWRVDYPADERAFRFCTPDCAEGTLSYCLTGGDRMAELVRVSL